jgi:hypothetical protein
MPSILKEIASTGKRGAERRMKDQGGKMKEVGNHTHDSFSVTSVISGT